MINERDRYLGALMQMRRNERWAEIKSFLLDLMDYVEQSDEEPIVIKMYDACKDYRVIDG